VTVTGSPVVDAVPVTPRAPRVLTLLSKFVGTGRYTEPICIWTFSRGNRLSWQCRSVRCRPPAGAPRSRDPPQTSTQRGVAGRIGDVDTIGEDTECRAAGGECSAMRGHVDTEGATGEYRR
jgi:hypothetical protein